eukprot:756498-Hanusia_phi.AAC.1
MPYARGKRDTEEKIVADEVIRRTEAEISKRVHAALESEEFLQELQVRIDTAKKELTEKMLAEIKKELQEQKANILEEARNQTKACPLLDSKIISNSNGTQSKSLPPPPPTQSSSQLSRSTPQPPNVPPPPPPPPPPSAPSRSSALVPDHNPGDVEMEVDHEEEERLNRLRGSTPVARCLRLTHVPELEEKARLQQEQMKREQEVSGRKRRISLGIPDGSCQEDERRKKEQQLILGKGTNSKDKTRAKLSFGLMKK